MKIRSLLTLGLTLILLSISPVYSAINFDKVDDSLACGTSDSLLSNATALTISAWINSTDMGEGNAGRVIVKATSTAGVRLQMQATNAISFRAAGATTLMRTTDNGTITPGSWQHVLATWDGSTAAANVHIYINGVEATYQTTTDQITPTSNAGQAIKIGSEAANGTLTFAGLISEVAVWSSELGAEDRNTLYVSGRMKRMPLQVSPSTLQAYWPLATCADGANCDAVVFNDLKGTNTCTGSDGNNNTGLSGVAEGIFTYQ